MKKALLFIGLFASAIVLRAQIDVLYQGNVVNDTIVVYEQSPNEESYIYLKCKNNSDAVVSAQIAATTIYGTEDIHVMSICVPGSCVPGVVSGVFNMLPNGEAEWDAWIEINEGLANGTSTLFSFTIQDTLNADNNKTVFVKYIIGENSVNALSKNNVSIDLYPNPARNVVNIEYNLSGSNAMGSKIEIRNMLGSVVKEISIADNQSIQRINVSEMPNGVYLCSVVCNGKVCKTKKMVVKH